MSNPMLEEVRAQPANLESCFEQIDRMMRYALNPKQSLSLHRVFTTGCGDSHHVSLCTEMSFENIAGLPCEPMMAMQMGRYGANYIPVPFPDDPLVIGISVSGTVSRTIEAVKQARKRGALTMALTSGPETPVAQVAELVAPVELPPDLPKAPGTTSFAANFVALTMLAIRLGEVRNRYHQTDADALRSELRSTFDIMARTIEVMDPLTQDLANELKDAPEFVFVGHGPNFGSALFSAAKVIEASGAPALGQDTEEWAHLQYFCVRPETPTIVICPPSVGYSRAAELIPVMKRIGRKVIAVVDSQDTEIASGADAVLPVQGQMREEFSPLVYTLAAELFAAHHSDATGEPPFRAFSGVYDSEATGGNTIRNSAILGD